MQKIDYSLLEKITAFLPDKMKLMATSPAGGLLEVVISIGEYENLWKIYYGSLYRMEGYRERAVQDCGDVLENTYFEGNIRV